MSTHQIGKGWPTLPPFDREMVWRKAFSTFGYSPWTWVCWFLNYLLYFQYYKSFIFSDGLEAFIGGWDRKRISLANLTEFIRFNEVRLLYSSGLLYTPWLLTTKCQLFEDYLNAIKPALKNFNKLSFVADINQADPGHFSDHSSVVIYLRDRLLPIFDSSRRYEFNISFKSDENSATEVISSILQISQVQSCSHVSIVLSIELFGKQSARMPVEDISNWLTPKTVEGAEICGKKGENRFLQIRSYIISNKKEMWEHLIKVNFFIANFFHRPHLEIWWG